jgi:hypothetical protein
MQVIFHVGPHKTGTTSIQNFMQLNSAFLKSSGVYVPEPLSSLPGNHEIPWALLGWDLRLIESRDSSVSLETYLYEVIQEARKSSCTSILFSSEDFSLLDEGHWRKLLSDIESITSTTEPVSFRIVSVFRQPKQYLPSQYKTLVVLGLSKKFEDVSDALDRHFMNVHDGIRKLPDLYDGVLEVAELKYVSSGLMAVFWKALFPWIDIPLDLLREVRANVSHDDKVIEQMRQENLDANLDFDINRLLHWPAFHDLASSSETVRRFQNIVALSERDS